MAGEEIENERKKEEMGKEEACIGSQVVFPNEKTRVKPASQEVTREVIEPVTI